MNDLESVKDHFATIKDLLNRQKLVENLVHRQEMPRHDLVESLVHKQNLVELERLLDKLSTTVIARILEALSEDERQTIWQLVRDVRKEEILLEISDSVRVELVSEPKLTSQSM